MLQNKKETSQPQLADTKNSPYALFLLRDTCLSDMSNFTNNNVTPSGEDDNGNYISNSTAFEINEILLPKIAAFCSMVGSTIIITEVLRDWKHERRTGKGVGAVSRTLFFMSISDFIFSL